MNAFLTIVLIVAMIAVVIALVRGIVAFLQTTKLDLENVEDAEHATQMQQRQNKMMFNRIKFQALAVLVVAVLLLFNS